MKYNVSYFLSALGAGGLAVSFFMYLMFLIPHPTTPLPTFEIVFSYFNSLNMNSILITFCLSFILFFSLIHFKLLYLNTKEYFQINKKQNSLSFMVVPLTYAMTINVCFILGAVFVPKLWSIVEYLFPFALLGFLITGFYALKIFINYLIEEITKKTYKEELNNNFSSLISVFCFSMISVGFAAPGAMSTNQLINAIGISFSLFFLFLAIILSISFSIISFKNILLHGINKETTPTFLIFIPILTLFGITFIRILFGLNHHLGMELDKIFMFVLTITIISLQVLFGVFGYILLNKISYFKEYIYGTSKSSLSFALICPGVALFVFGMFFINQGLVFSGLLEKYSFVYFLLFIPFVFIQLKTIKYFYILYKKHF